ncbi:hypothetical protein D9619_005630 [Psilocybe cf. subviscida]|uniref:Chromosome segregation in meiosis protein n=1 Tax=Psilocybe cf. subviscida TaxID=2480587 RepID=A0A8H5FBW2_9AGAR|nr:hypothetical protein D9619_005630 [Psilocybe cf. subviscida]
MPSWTSGWGCCGARPTTDMMKSRASRARRALIKFASGKQTSTTRSMDSLDSIWDEPAVETVQKRSSQPPDDRDDPHRPAKRPRQALFLSDSEDDMDASGPTRLRAPVKAPPLNAELDALFADSDDEELRPLPGRIDEAEITRRAEERARREMPALTPYQVMPSSSPPRDTGSPSGKKSGKGDTEKKERRRIVKLDEARLLNPTHGFPQLVKMTKDFKIKGKGHEAADLSRLLQKYQYWTHQLYPKLQFQDTVERVEKLCHSRRMNVALSVWRDEALGRPGGRQGLDIDDDEEDTGAIDDEDQAEQNQAMDTDHASTRAPRSSPSVPSSRASSPPATSGAESSSRGPGPRFSEPEPDEDEEFWKSLDDFGDSSMDARAPPSPPKAAPAPAPPSGFDDEDMWDIINEVEKEASGSGQRPAASGGQPPPTVSKPSSKSPLAGAPEPGYADPSEWDDMYVD